MSGETISGKWQQFTGKVKQEWGDLTDDDFTFAEGSLDRLAGRIEEKYGETKHEVREKLQRMQDES